MADAGTRWSYNNVFQKLMDVTAAASGQSFDAYFTTKIKNKLGMDGFWNNGIIYKIYNSNTRSMARFGLMALNKGKWKNEQIINETFFNQSVTTSQNINPSYGYLWWLNGKNSFMVPGGQTVFCLPYYRWAGLCRGSAPAPGRHCRPARHVANRRRKRRWQRQCKRPRL